MNKPCRRCGGTARYPGGSRSCVQCHKVYNRKVYVANRLHRREMFVLRRYGLAPAEFQRMLEFQAGLCAICTEPMSPGKLTHVDHCHATGAIRGLLCRSCNTGLGCFRDMSMLLEGAVPYLNAA